MSATSVFDAQVGHWLREFVPDQLARCIPEQDMFVAHLWGRRQAASGDPLTFYFYEGDYTSLGNVAPYGAYYTNADVGQSHLCSQEWVTLSMTMHWSDLLDVMASAAGNEQLRFNKFNEEMARLHLSWANYFGLQTYGDGNPMTVNSAPPHTVETIDGLEAAVGRTSYAGLDPTSLDDPNCWRSYTRTLTNATFSHLVTAGTSYYLPTIVDNALSGLNCTDADHPGIQMGVVTPDLIVCDSVVGSAWRYIANANMQIVRPERKTVWAGTVGELGFDTVTYLGIPVWVSPTLDEERRTTGENKMYILTTRFFDMLYLPEREFSMKGPTHLEAYSDEIAYAWLWAGQLRCSQRRHQAKIDGLPTTGPADPGA